MTLTWLMQNFMSCSFYDRKFPTVIRMGIAAYQEYLDKIQYMVDRELAVTRFQGARVIMDNRMPDREVEFGYEVKLPETGE